MSGRSGTSARLAAYAAMGRVAHRETRLERNLRLAVALLAAELSGCGWCIGRAQHDWLKAGRPEAGLTDIREHRTSPIFTEREHAALAFAEAVISGLAGESGVEPAFALARRHFAEAEVAELTSVVTAEHFYDPVTGELGRSNDHA